MSVFTVRIPAERSVSHWGILPLRAFELVELEDRGSNPRTGEYTSLLHTSMGSVRSVTHQHEIEHAADVRYRADMAALARVFGVKPDELEVVGQMS